MAAITATMGQKTLSGTAQVVWALNADRKGFFLQNNSTEDIRYTLDAGNPTTTYGLLLKAGESVGQSPITSQGNNADYFTGPVNVINVGVDTVKLEVVEFA